MATCDNDWTLMTVLLTHSLASGGTSLVRLLLLFDLKLKLRQLQVHVSDEVFTSVHYVALD